MGSSSAEAFPAIQEIMLEFRAGKMTMEGTRVIPDTRKGLIRIGRGEEGLVHFQWLDRMLYIIVDDQIIFPDEAVFEKVNQSSGRVYILKFNSDDRKFFFWMQEPAAEGDEQICSSVNHFINQPIEFLGEDDPESSVPLHAAEDVVEEDVSSRAGNLVVPHGGTDAMSDVTSSSGPVKMEVLQKILSNIGNSDIHGEAEEGLGLGDILKPDLIVPLLDSLPVQERLVSYLPEGKWNSDEIIELMQSPPFRQQLDSFTYVLRTGQIDLSQFGVDPSKYKFTVLSFLEALEDSVAKEKGAEQCKSSNPMDES